MAQVFAAIEAGQVGPSLFRRRTRREITIGSYSEPFIERIDNLVLNQGMKGCNYVIAYVEYEEDSAGPFLPCHVGRWRGPVCARCSCAGSTGAGSTGADCSCPRGGSCASTAEDRHRRYGLG